MLTLHTGNRLEDLATALAETLRDHNASPLQPVRIAVPSNGMARWLFLQLAAHNHIAANIDFPLPGKLIWQLFQATLTDVPSLDTSAFSTGPMTWRLFSYFQDNGGIDPDIDAYLEQADVCGRFELARQLADVFDQYLIYRPDWILQWERGESDHWQARLWRQLLADLGGGPHRGHLLHAFMEKFPAQGEATGSTALEEFAPQLYIFGLSSIPPAYLNLLSRIQQYIQVHIFHLTPSKEFTADLVPETTITQKTLAGATDTPYLERGHPLVASWGRQGAEMESLLLEQHPDAEKEYFVEPSPESVLTTLQADILHLRDPSSSQDQRPGALNPHTAAANLTFEVCHSPLREVEVLYERLLGLFDRYSDLRPSDVLVMTPDIEAYAPHIEAVFGNPDDRPAIPFKLADLGARSTSSLIEAAFKLLELPASRYGVNDILELLQLSPIQDALQIGAQELAAIRTWVRDTRICWGIDGSFRAQQGLPAEEEHTWTAGLDRQLLGYALPGDGQSLFQGILPYSEIEGSWAQTLGRFQAFVRDLCRWRPLLQEEHSPSDWHRHLVAYLHRFLARGTTEQAADMAALARQLAYTAQLAQRTDCRGSIPREIMVRELEKQLALKSEGRNFLGYGVTFCAMTPMRAIPHEVVFLLGMNDGAFPRLQRPPAFDLMAEAYRPGDRARREDDRYLFLETLLSARRYLGISYVGFDIRSNAVRPPSVLVSELAAAINETFPGSSEGTSWAEMLTTRHPLHAFSPDYFNNQHPNLYSYSRNLRQAAQQLLPDTDPPATPTFFHEQLPEPEAHWQSLELAEAISFFCHPAKFLLQKRLGIQLDPHQQEPESREPFVLPPLEKHNLRQYIFDLWQQGLSTQKAQAITRAAGLLPHGQAGDAAFERVRLEVDRFTHRLAEFGVGDQDLLPPRDINLALSAFRLYGSLDDLRPQGQMLFRCGNLNAAMAVEGWLRHLALCAVAPQDLAKTTRLLTLDASICLPPLAATEAQHKLDELGNWLWQGLQQPLPLTPWAGFTYARQRAATNNHNSALKQAKDQWSPHAKSSVPGESEDPYNALAYGDENPVDKAEATFVKLAESLFLSVTERWS